ncbi:MAG TPA: hypothetical protein VFO17_10375 [Acidimicrobiia bacterium]|nr:hypothetical protein [Acidimicrobiia bacterium]
MEIVAYVLMGLGVALFVFDKLTKPPNDEEFGVRNVSEILSAAGIPFPNLVFIVGFIILMFDQGWLQIDVSGGNNDLS